jgi:hypothetical protein
LSHGDPNSWPPTVELRDPDDNAVNPEVTVGWLYRLLTVDQPSSGVWTLRTTQSFEDPVSRTLVTAHIENRVPDCFAGFNTPIIREAGQVRLFVEPEYDGFSILEGATLTAVVRRPDYSTLEVDVPFDPLREQYAVEFPSSELRGRGSYQAVVRCEVSDGAQVAHGESFGRELPPVDVQVVGFTRETTASFFLDTAELPPLPGEDSPFAGDCDGDGIADELEPAGDLDGDGAPDVCDGDADGDDLPDALDPDPTRPDVACPEYPPSLACCSDLATCAGGGFAVYAAGELRLADRTWVLQADGGFAPVANAGLSGTDIGTDTLLGDLWSASAVLLRERAHVEGSVWSGGAVDEQNAVVVTGNRYSGVDLTFPPLAGFTYSFQGGVLAPVSLEPDAQMDLEPGAYAGVEVKSRAVLRLHSGLYEFESLVVHPEAHIELDTSTGPVHIYARASLVFRGILSGTSDPAELMFASFGESDVIIEAPFKGTVAAPNAKVIVAGGMHQGAFFGRHVQVNPDALIVHEAFRHVWPHVEPGPCSNGLQDGTETDVDCGGLECGPCSVGRACLVDADCQTSICQSGVCASWATVTATLTLTSSWDAGYCADVRVENSGPEPTAGWQVLIDLRQSSPTGWWNGAFAEDGAQLAVQALEYNAVIWPGSAATFGFCAVKSGLDWTPSVIGAIPM